MNSTGAVIVGLLAICAAIFGYVITNQYQGNPSYQVGSITVPTNKQPDLRSLTNRTAGATDGNYDSLDLPRGTTFAVPASSTLVITLVEFPGVAATATATITVGYGDDAVGNSGAPPTNAVTTWSRTYSGQPDPASTTFEVPAAKIAWVRVQGAGTWTSAAVGILR